MDPNSGHFYPDDGSLPADWPRFNVGQEVWINGNRFIVQRIDCERHELILRHERLDATEDLIYQFKALNCEKEDILRERAEKEKNK